MRKLLLGGIAVAALMGAPALAADLPMSKEPAPARSWTGWYVGVQVGYGWSSNSVDLVTGGVGTSADPPPFVIVPGVSITNRLGLGALAATSGAAAVPGTFNTAPRGLIAGSLLGYDWQLAPRWVAGIETDVSEASIRGSQSLAGGNGSFGVGTAFLNIGPVTIPILGFSTAAATTASGSTEQKLDWLGTLRGRLGFLVTDKLLVFATGGLAYGHVSANTTVFEGQCVTIGVAAILAPAAPPGCTSGIAVGSFSQTRVGSAIGGGLQFAIAPNWSVKTEYLYWDLGRASYALSPMLLQSTTTIAIINQPATAGAVISSVASSRFNGDLMRVSVNYKFD
jgi:outer membrane immunogenic protein